MDFIGHALALHRDDRYLDEPALDTVKRMKVKTAWGLFSSFLFILFLYLFLNPDSCLLRVSTALYCTHYFLVSVNHVIALCGVSCTFSRRITIHLSFVWIGRAPPGLILTPTPLLKKKKEKKNFGFGFGKSIDVDLICPSGICTT